MRRNTGKLRNVSKVKAGSNSGLITITKAVHTERLRHTTVIFKKTYVENKIRNMNMVVESGK